MHCSVGVVGAGVMGAGIAQVLAVAGHRVVCYDVGVDALRAGERRIRAGRYGLESAVERGKITQHDAAATIQRLTFAPDKDALYDSDIVVEAVPERLDLKIEVFRDLDRHCPEATILATNSSGFPVCALAAATDRPERVIGWHWASPVPVMRLAEIVRGPATSDATVEFVTAMAAGAGKNPIVIKDTARTWGYVANRVYFAMVREADQVVREGIASADQVDQLMIDCFRWPIGPLSMAGRASSGWS